MRLLMVVSADGYVAREKDDDMTWTGPWDKSVFKLLTHVDSGVVGAGSNSYRLLPPLPGRMAIKISSTDKNGMTLHEFEHHHPGGWLIGGQNVALNAVALGYVGEAYICHSERKCFPTDTAVGYLLDTMINDLSPHPNYHLSQSVKVGDIKVAVWKINPKFRRYPKSVQVPQVAYDEGNLLK